jgi:ferredoxin-like protein FixX
MRAQEFDLDSLVKHIPGTGDFITIDQNKCNRCGRCLIICLLGLWKKKDDKIFISEEYKEKCLECAGCYQVCETGAISFKYPAGGTGVVFEQG